MQTLPPRCPGFDLGFPGLLSLDRGHPGAGHRLSLAQYSIPTESLAGGAGGYGKHLGGAVGFCYIWGNSTQGRGSLVLIEITFLEECQK